MLLSEAWLDEFQLCIIRKHINHTSWTIYDNSHTPHNYFPSFQGSVFISSGTHCKGVSKQLCVYHLYRNVFLAQTRIRSHLGCIFLFRNSFQYPQSKRYSKRVSKRLSRVVAFIIDLSVSRVRVARKALSLRSCIAQFHPKHNAFKGVSKQLCVYHLYRNVFLAQTRISDRPFSPRFRKAFLTP